MFTLFRFYAFLLFAGLVVFSGSMDAMPASAPVRHNGISYITGGIGQTEVEAFRAQAQQYNLRMTFTTKSGAFLSDVDVSIWNMSRHRVLRVRTEGPFLFVRLPAGRYQIEIHLGPQSATKAVQVPARGGSEAVFRLDDPDTCGVILLCKQAR
ncbi:MAG: carboxypeptidase regulatory-like domain-containing protein [Paraburkholderia tropica]|uniref:Carboxypeptidase regulatory-like domain-containing protein n=1 Tax=Paraburkholderia tropica TaxID=92647 RepID=A0ABX5MHV9_9BURK|nr:carboxypeptidase-like regulatory domain-containing protein [Paraburkholderia tropica]MDE1144038.1 carboxypeptidase regulatory-like domain-containing protein [Paraburkholderia tropica]PXX11506.1 hypothetical protein C7400_11973 [Paraburkholderia tropica]PZW76169.1 hypothetical protein C7399_11973 [Paraburkholderia tropica]